MTTDQLRELYDLTVTAERCVEMMHTDAALSALAKARRLLGEMQKPSEELKVLSHVHDATWTRPLHDFTCRCTECCDKKPSPASDPIDLNIGVPPCGSRTQSTTSPSPTAGSGSGCPSSDAPRTSSDPIDRTLPPGFEVRKFAQGWYPLDLRGPKTRAYYQSSCGECSWLETYRDAANPSSRESLCGSGGYPTEAAAYADAPRWLAAAGVDWPQVTGPHDDADELEMQAHIDGVMSAYNAIPKTGARGSVECPMCKGKLNWTRAVGYNNHIHAKCETPDCLAWME